MPDIILIPVMYLLAYAACPLIPFFIALIPYCIYRFVFHRQIMVHRTWMVVFFGCYTGSMVGLLLFKTLQFAPLVTFSELTDYSKSFFSHTMLWIFMFPVAFVYTIIAIPLLFYVNDHIEFHTGKGFILHPTPEKSSHKDENDFESM